MTTTIERLRTEVRDAENELASKREELAILEREERRRAQDAVTLRTLGADRNEFYLPEPAYLGERAVLPFGNTVTPNKLSVYDTESHPFGKSWLAHTAALVVLRTDQNRTRPTRLVYTAGTRIDRGDRIGATFTARHDQTGSKLGVYRIVGIVIYDGDGNVARVVGDVPETKLALSTYK